MKYRFALFLSSLFWSQFSVALCTYVPVVETEITVTTCETITPSSLSGVEDNFLIIRGTGPNTSLGVTYGGALVTAGATRYFLRDSSLSACSTFDAGDRLWVSVTTACCDTGQAPCLLGTSKVISVLQQ